MTTIAYILYIIGGIIGLIIFYYVVKTAVKHGIIEARINNEYISYVKERKPELPMNSEQLKLQNQYNNGEITFEEYQAEWKKVS
jgi:uncharacterized membrane protein